MAYRADLNGLSTAGRQTLVKVTLQYLILVMASINGVQSAFAQLEPIEPILENFRGGMIWASFGGFSAKDYDHNLWRGGFAALFGPFYFSEPDKTEYIDDTIVVDSTFTKWVRDTLRGGCKGKPAKYVKLKRLKQYRTKTMIVNKIKKETRDKSWRQLNVAFGYVTIVHGRIRPEKLNSSIPVSGLALAAFFDAFKISSLEGALGLGIGFLSASNVPALVRDTAIVFSTETKMSPEIYGILSYKFFFIGGSYQHLRFSSIQYSPRDEGVSLPGDLPDDLNLSSFHVIAGLRWPKL